MIKTVGYNLKIASEAILQNKTRSILTSLGIIFGVASVITMLAIGKGAEQEILEKMRLLGTNNIILEHQEPFADSDTEEESDESPERREAQAKRFTPGMTLQDVRNIRDIVPGIVAISPEIVTEVIAMHQAISRTVKLVGIMPEYFTVNDVKISNGEYFNEQQTNNAEPVCIIGSTVSSRLFPGINPIGKRLKCGSQWLTVIGVTDSKIISGENIKDLGIRDYNLDVYIPITTMLLRFENRALVTQRDLQRRGRQQTPERTTYNQIDKIIVQVENTETMLQTADIIDRLMLRKHNQVRDYKIIIPEALLEQEQSAKRIFNFVLGAIASISLIVGGIGIMNIMLASVLERTKEIGVRKAVGAKRADIMIQFLSEAVAISFTGGIIGIILGVSAGYVVELLTDIQTIITPLSIILSFVVSISVGLIFGIMPARRASLQDPIDLLRYE